MKYVKSILATTHIDKHNEKISVEGLESMVAQINSCYSSVGIEHDPRIPPVGRFKSAVLKELENGEHGVEATIEVFEPTDQITLEDEEGKEIKIKEHSIDYLDIMFDRNYDNSEDLETIKEINDLIKSKTTPVYSIKKAVEPLSILTIGGGFVVTAIAAGFFGKLGSDACGLLKNKLKKLFSNKKEGEKEKLLVFEFTVNKDKYPVNVEIILTDPDDIAIDSLLDYGLKEVDEILPKYFNEEIGLKRIVLEYKNLKMKVSFGVLKNGVPIAPMEDNTV